MNGFRFLLILILITIFLIYRGRGIWRELMRIWGRRDYVLKVLVFAIGIYLLYGLYSMYQRGMLELDYWF